jgi:hypothetical protein
MQGKHDACIGLDGIHDCFLHMFLALRTQLCPALPVPPVLTYQSRSHHQNALMDFRDIKYQFSDAIVKYHDAWLTCLQHIFGCARPCRAAHFRFVVRHFLQRAARKLRWGRGRGAIGSASGSATHGVTFCRTILLCATSSHRQTCWLAAHAPWRDEGGATA